jgi:hypothetical protein
LGANGVRLENGMIRTTHTDKAIGYRG